MAISSTYRPIRQCSRICLPRTNCLKEEILPLNGAPDWSSNERARTSSVGDPTLARGCESCGQLARKGMHASKIGDLLRFDKLPDHRCR